MIQEGITQIDIKQVLRQKAPSVARKIPGFMVDYLIRTVHQDELNEILRRYHDKDGVAFMQELIGYFDLNLELVNEENIPAEGRYIFASNHPLGRNLPVGHYRRTFRREDPLPGERPAALPV